MTLPGSSLHPFLKVSAVVSGGLVQTENIDGDLGPSFSVKDGAMNLAASFKQTWSRSQTDLSRQLSPPNPKEWPGLWKNLFVGIGSILITILVLVILRGATQPGQSDYTGLIVSLIALLGI